MIYIFWSCRDRDEAKRVIHLLLEKRLIACASILLEVESIYRWEGKVEEAKEVKVILKSQKMHFEAVRSVICEQGSYEVPEICGMSVEMCNPSYLSWLAQETY